MTEKEYKLNKIKGYGIVPCLILGIITDAIISENIHTTVEMELGLFLFGIVLFCAWTTIWFWIVEIWYKKFH